MNATTLMAYFSHIQKESGGANENSHLHRASACAEGPRLSLAFAALRFVSFRFVSPKSVQCEPVGEELFFTFSYAKKPPVWMDRNTNYFNTSFYRRNSQRVIYA